MLSGKVPFSGETVNHTMVSILEKEPPLLEKVPAELQRIVRKSMTKDVEMRYQSARDLLIDLTNLRRDLDIQGELERSVVRIVRLRIPHLKMQRRCMRLTWSRRHEVASSGYAKCDKASSSSLEYAVSQARSISFRVR